MGECEVGGGAGGVEVMLGKRVVGLWCLERLIGREIWVMRYKENGLLWWGGKFMIEFLICWWGGARCGDPGGTRQHIAMWAKVGAENHKSIFALNRHCAKPPATEFAKLDELLFYVSLRHESRMKAIMYCPVLLATQTSVQSTVHTLQTRLWCDNSF